MALKEIVVDGYEVTLTQTNATPGPYTGFTITQVIDKDCKAETKGIISGPTISWVASACQLTDHTFTSGAGTISATSVKCKMKDKTCFLKGDIGACAGSFVNNKSALVVACACTAEITNAGQTTVKGS